MRWFESWEGWFTAPSSKNLWLHTSYKVNDVLSSFERRSQAWEDCKKYLSSEQINAVQITKEYISIYGIKIALYDQANESDYSENALTREEWTRIFSLTYGNFDLQNKFLGDVLWMNLKSNYWTSTEGFIENTAYYFWVPVGVINTITLKTQKLKIRGKV